MNQLIEKNEINGESADAKISFFFFQLERGKKILPVSVQTVSTLYIISVITMYIQIICLEHKDIQFPVTQET